MFMLGKPTTKKSYSGRDSYKYVEKVLVHGKELLVVSPFIDTYYADFLSRHSRGRKVYVLSSSIEEHARKAMQGGGLRRTPIVLILIMVLLDYVFYALGDLTLPVIAVSIVIIIISALLIKRGKGSSITLRIPRSFVHAKMYISDNEAAYGSANLTFAGMHKNIEHIDVIEGDEVKRLRGQFWRMWKEA